MTELKPYKRSPIQKHHQPGFKDILSLYELRHIPGKKKGFHSIVPTKREFYKELKEKHPNLQQYRDQEILKCIEGFNKLITDTIIDYRDGVQLPANMGLLMVCTMGKRTNSIDHKKSAELGVEVHMQNYHSDGYGGGVYYSTCMPKENQTKKVHMYRNCQYWTMHPSAALKKQIQKAYLEDWKKYHMVPKSRRYEDMVEDSYQKQMKNKQDVKQIKDTYDEFRFTKDYEDD